MNESRQLSGSGGERIEPIRERWMRPAISESTGYVPNVPTSWTNVAPIYWVGTRGSEVVVYAPRIGLRRHNWIILSMGILLWLGLFGTVIEVGIFNSSLPKNDRILAIVIGSVAGVLSLAGILAGFFLANLMERGKPPLLCASAELRELSLPRLGVRLAFSDVVRLEIVCFRKTIGDTSTPYCHFVVAIRGNQGRGCAHHVVATSGIGLEECAAIVAKRLELQVVRIDLGNIDKQG